MTLGKCCRNARLHAAASTCSLRALTICYNRFQAFYWPEYVNTSVCPFGSLAHIFLSPCRIQRSCLVLIHTNKYLAWRWKVRCPLFSADFGCRNVTVQGHVQCAVRYLSYMGTSVRKGKALRDRQYRALQYDETKSVKKMKYISCTKTVWCVTTLRKVCVY